MYRDQSIYKFKQFKINQKYNSHIILNLEVKMSGKKVLLV